MQIINRICLATLFLFTLNLSAQDDGMPADMGDTGDPCGDVEYPVADPGPDGGCADYADCNGNGAFDLGEPCFEGTDDGDGEEDSMPMFEDVDSDGDGNISFDEAVNFFGDDEGNTEEFNSRDTNGDGMVDSEEFYAGEDSGDEDDDHDGPPPFEDVDANGDGSIDREEARAFFGDDPNFDEEYDNVDASGDGAVDHAEYMAADDGDHGDEGSGEAQDGYYCAICDMDFGSAEEMDQHAADMGHVDTDMDHEGDHNDNGDDEGGDN